MKTLSALNEQGFIQTWTRSLCLQGGLFGTAF